jgi:hypothetical protein
MAWQSSTINPATTSPASDITKLTNDLQVLRSVLGGGSDGDVPLTPALNASTGTVTIAGGNVGIGTATAPTSGANRFWVSGTRAIDARGSSASEPVITAWSSATSGDNMFLSFRTEATDTQRGTIDYNRSGGLVRYNTTSDYRAKDILGPLQDSGATIDALKVYEGRMKGATQSRPMMVAHEAQEHLPYAVSGEKDEENEDGTPKFQQMDHASLVPLLIAELQSLRARVAALEKA